MYMKNKTHDVCAVNTFTIIVHLSLDSNTYIHDVNRRKQSGFTGHYLLSISWTEPGNQRLAYRI